MIQSAEQAQKLNAETLMQTLAKQNATAEHFKSLESNKLESNKTVAQMTKAELIQLVKQAYLLAMVECEANPIIPPINNSHKVMI